MSKLITVEMIKNGMDVPGAFCDVCKDSRDVIKKEFKAEDLMNEDCLAPLNPYNVEDDFDVVVGVGLASMAVLKKMCTPEAWELIVDELKKTTIMGD